MFTMLIYPFKYFIIEAPSPPRYTAPYSIGFIKYASANYTIAETFFLITRLLFHFFLVCETCSVYADSKIYCIFIILDIGLHRSQFHQCVVMFFSHCNTAYQFNAPPNQQSLLHHVLCKLTWWEKLPQ